jgi:hypothetical protein
MKYPNLVLASNRDRLANYQVAMAAQMSESRFSRCLSGRTEFRPEERAKIAMYLGYHEGWLFQQVDPPVRVSRPNRISASDPAISVI